MLRALALALIRFYRALPLPGAHGHCRHYPTCSAYALEAVDRHGAMRGLALAARRLLRCHPLGTSGFDPVP